MSITLTSPKGITITGANPVNETDNIAAVTGYSIDFISNDLIVQYATGSLLNGNIVVGAYADRYTMTVNLLTGKWSSSNGQSGNVSGPALVNFNTEVKTDRNLMEVFAAATFIPGVQVVWP